MCPDQGIRNPKVISTQTDRIALFICDTKTSLTTFPMKDQLCNLHWEVCVFVRELEGVKIPLFTNVPLGERGSVYEATKFFIYGIKEENVSINSEGSHVSILVNNVRIHISQISWEIRESSTPNISTAGYIDTDVVKSELTFRVLLEANHDTSLRVIDLRLGDVEAELVHWDATIKHTKDQIYDKYSGLSNGRIKKAIEAAFTQHVAQQFSEKIQAKREAAQRANDAAKAIVPDRTTVYAS